MENIFEKKRIRLEKFRKRFLKLKIKGGKKIVLRKLNINNNNKMSDEKINLRGSKRCKITL